MTTLLIIDDDLTITEMLELVLPSRGYDVVATNSSEDGIEAFRRRNPDVIILDLMMPGVDGWLLCRQIREESQVPILVLSAVVEASGIAKAMACGASDFLTKPAPLATLITRIDRLLEK